MSEFVAGLSNRDIVIVAAAVIAIIVNVAVDLAERPARREWARQEVDAIKRRIANRNRGLGN